MNPDLAATATPSEAILNALALHQECSRGDLLSAAGLQSYSELETLLVALSGEGKITAHWHDLGFRTYRLVETKPETPWWMLPPKPG